MDVVLLGEVEELVSDVNTNISAVKSVVDAINSNTSIIEAINTNVVAIKTNTAANSTESSTGTLSQKLAYLINRRDRIVTPSSTNIKTLFTGTKTGTLELAKDACYTSSVSTREVNVGSWGCYMKQCGGKLRVYVTGNGSFTTTASSERTAGFVGFKIYVTVYDGQSQKTSTTTCGVDWYNKDVTLNGTTKTLDVYFNKGNYIDVNVKMCLTTSSEICNNYCYYPMSSTLNITEVKICGTANELNGLTT